MGEINQGIQTFPSAYVKLLPETIDPALQFAGMYKPTLEVTLKIRTQLVASSQDPAYDNNDLIFDAYEDIKKALYNGIDHAESVNILSMEIMPSKNRDQFRPSNFDIKMTVIYKQDRQDPDTPACS